ncbi:short chain dehydrogenase [Streptomyces caatingaensis]|uniref:Short-chain dehydrogenase n=1 Tax=Streptomyces caatingaensis TaxID=1678637 RepID=A0A0K9XFP9_9ACTN|nr:short chain dehydrogenase [Streptomyces caatingaensis]KNB52068.1 short-chain dehydrogenase [Streptomyces caatingaensis]
MKILLVGASGTLGSAVAQALDARGHELVTVGRGSGDVRLDVSDPQAVGRLYERVTGLDAVAVAGGEAVFKPLDALSGDDFTATLRTKALSQIELVRQGARHLAPNGSFTLVTGILSEEPVAGGAAASAANGAVEAFVRAAAIELAPRRVNAVSPTLLTESVEAYGDIFAGYEPVPAASAAAAYVRSVEGRHTGRVYRVGF